MERTLTDIYDFSEHFDILFAIFWIVVQKILNFKVYLIFCLISKITEKGRSVFLFLFTRAGLATPADRWVPGTRQRPRWRDGPLSVLTMARGHDRRGRAVVTAATSRTAATHRCDLNLTKDTYGFYVSRRSIWRWRRYLQGTGAARTTTTGGDLRQATVAKTKQSTGEGERMSKRTACSPLLRGCSCRWRRRSGAAAIGSTELHRPRGRRGWCGRSTTSRGDSVDEEEEDDEVKRLAVFDLLGEDPGDGDSTVGASRFRPWCASREREGAGVGKSEERGGDREGRAAACPS